MARRPARWLLITLCLVVAQPIGGGEVAPQVAPAAADALDRAQQALDGLHRARDAGTAEAAYAYALSLVGRPLHVAEPPAVPASVYFGALAPQADLSAVATLPSDLLERLDALAAIHAAAQAALATGAALPVLESLRAALVREADAWRGLAADPDTDAAPIDVCGVLYVDIGGAGGTHTCDYRVSVGGTGDDTYHNRAGGSSTGQASIAIDLGGNDHYLGIATTAGGVNGGADQGFGALIDLAGDDVYNGRAVLGGVNGGARHGAALLIDFVGDDTYNGQVVQGGVNGGAGFAGSGALLDLGGSDEAFNGTVSGLSGGVNGGSNDGLGLLYHCGAGRNTYNGHVQERGGVNSGGEQNVAVFASCGGTYTTYSGYAGGGGVNGGSSSDSQNVFVHLQGDALFDGAVRYGGVNGGSYLGTSWLVSGTGSTTYQARIAGPGGVNGGGVLGAGGLVDLGGDDTYVATGPGTIAANGGAFLGGVGLLVDAAGDDVYLAALGGAPNQELNVVAVWPAGWAANGMGHFGACGLLYDAAGADGYQDGPGTPYETDALRVQDPPGCGLRFDAGPLALS